MDETTVTECVARYLASRKWTIHSVHHPGAQGGVRLRPTSATGSRSKETLIPDIVASKQGVFLLVESKPRFDVRDVRKVQRAAQPAYVAGLAAALELAVHPSLVLPAVAFSGLPPAAVAPGVVLFIVSPAGHVEVAGAAELLPGYRSSAGARRDLP